MKKIFIFVLLSSFLALTTTLALFIPIFAADPPSQNTDANNTSVLPPDDSGLGSDEEIENLPVDPPEIPATSSVGTAVLVGGLALIPLITLSRKLKRQNSWNS
jgi:hypothetical protein